MRHRQRRRGAEWAGRHQRRRRRHAGQAGWRMRPWHGRR